MLAATLVVVAGRAVAQDSPPGAERPMRVIRVRVACDEEFRRRDRWKSEAALRVTFASQVYEREFRISWPIADIVEWDSKDDAPTLDSLLEEAKVEVGTGGADVLVALTGQAGPLEKAEHYDLYGVAVSYGRFALSRAERATDETGFDTAVLCHELGHVLGAWHPAARNSVMSTGSFSKSLLFDDVARRTIELGRDLDFETGVESLGADRERQLVEIYRNSQHGERCWFPVASGWATRGNALAAKVPLSGAAVAAAYERSAALHAEVEEPDGSHEVNARREASRWREWAGDLDAAIAQAELGAEVAKRCPSAEREPGAAALRLARLLDRRGDNARAAQIREEVRAISGHGDEPRTPPPLLITRSETIVGPRTRVTTAAWREDGFAHTVSDIVIASSSGTEASATGVAEFERPAPGEAHIRALSSAPREGGWEPGDGFDGEIVAVAASGAGMLEVEVVDEMRGIAAGAERVTRSALPCDPASPSGLARLGVFLRRRPGAKSSSENGWELLLLGGAANGPEPTARLRFALDGPADGALVRFAPESAARRFLRVGAEPATLRAWRWYPRQGGSTSVSADAETGAVLVDGKPVASREEPGPPGWRVVVRFVPAAQR